MSSHSSLPPGRLAALVIGVGLLASALVAWRMETENRNRDQQRFIGLYEQLERITTRRFHDLEFASRGAGALWVAKHGVVTRAEFADYVRDQELVAELPGALGIGFVRRVPRASVDDFLAATRADDAPDFKIKTLGDADELHIVEFMEPAEPNRTALGLDLAQDPIRRAAAERALLSGETAATRSVTLVQAPRSGPGFLVLHPVYTAGPLPSSPELRRVRLIGWTGLPVVTERLFAEITRELGEIELDFDVYEEGSASVGRPLYRHTHRESNSRRPPNLEQTTRLALGGVAWRLVSRPSCGFRGESRVAVSSTLIGGFGLSLAFGALVLRLRRSALRAEETAAAASTDLSALVDDVRLLALVATRTTNSVVFTDAHHRITWVNQGFTRITGYRPAEALGREPGELLRAEKTDPAVIEAMRAALDRGQPWKCEILNLHKNGTEYWAELDVVPLRDENGALNGFMSVQNEITARKAAEDKLREAADRAELALAAGGLGLWDWHVPSGRAHFDARWVAMLGENPATLPPREEEWSNRCHPEDLPVARATLQRHFAGETPLYQFLHRLRHHDGSWRWIMACGRLVSRTPAGEPLRMVGTHQDVTRQHLARLDLERNSAAFAHMARLAQVGFWEVDLVAGCIFWSEQVRAIHEVTADYVPNLATATAFYPAEAGTEISRLVQATIDRGEPFDVELPFVTARGNQRWVRSLGEAVRAAGVTVAIRGAFQDVTESRRQREALAAARDAAEAAARAKAEFLANMSHEIRTPINAVIGMTELLQTTRLSPEQTEFTDTIRTSSQSLLALINDILDFSKIEAGGLQIESAPFGLRDCIEHAIELVAGQAAATKLELYSSLDPALPPGVLGDAARLRQILVNLLGNAVKFTAAGEVELILAAPPPEPGHPPMLRFTVRDTGIGIPANRLDRLFKTFSQVDASTTRVYGGTGLGLAISARLVALMEGRIWVESTPGRGSSFHVEIPFRPAADPFPPPGLPPTLRGLSVLVVAPHPGLRRQLVAQTRAWGLRVVSAEDGASALARLEAGENFAAALLAAPAPDADPAALAALLRRPSAPRLLPLVLLAPRGEPLRGFAELPATRVVAKPPKSALLLDALVQVLRPAAIPPSSSALPVAAPPPSAAPAESSAPSALRIVLAEDLPVNQRVALLILETLGHTASVANHGFEALALVSRQPVDILFLDVQMPEMDGLTCAARLCEDYPPETRPWIIAMTANALEGDRERCLAAGMDDYISKPISGPAIAAAIERAVEGLAARRMD